MTTSPEIGAVTADIPPEARAVPADGPPTRRSDNLTRRTVAGLRWSYLAAFANAVLTVGYVAAMSRLLTPRAFGIVAMANIVVNFGQFFARMGVAQTIIQRPEINDDDIRVCWTSSTVLGIVVAAAAAVFAPQIAGIYRAPEVVPVLRALSLSFVVLGMGMTSLALLRRQMRFREIAIIDVTSTLVGVTLGIALALAGAGVWSLVAATLAGAALQGGLQYSRARYPLRPLLSWGRVRPLYASGSRFSLLRLMEFLGRNLDTVAVGRFSTAAVTGVYSRAYTLVSLPVQRYLSFAFAKVLFPSFASIQDDRARLGGALRSSLLLAGLVLGPVAAGMAVASRELVLVVLGDQFEAAVALVPFFALAAVLFVLSHVSQLVCEAIGELNRTIAVQVGSVAVLVALLVAAAGSDVWVFAAVLAVAEAVRHVSYLLLLRGVVGLSAAAVRRAYVPMLVASATVAAVVAAGRAVLVVAGTTAVGILVGEVVLGAAALVLAIRLMPFPEMRREVWARLRAAGLADRGGAVGRATALVLGRAPGVAR